MSTPTTHPKRASRFDRLYTGDGGFDFVGRARLWYLIAVVLLIISVGSIIFRGFDLGIDFEGGTKLSMQAGDLVAEEVEETFVESTGVEPALTQIIGSGDARTLEIQSEHLTQAQIDSARLAIYEEHQPVDGEGEPSLDAIGDSTVSESWGSTITQRMLLALVVFLIVAAVYVAARLQREMAAAAMLGLAFDAVLIAGIYSVFGLEVTPAVVIGLLTVLTFSIYDTVIVFDKVKENTTGVLDSRRSTYGEQANLAVNQTVMRSFSTSMISALPIIALLIVAVWLMGVGTLRDLALIQLIGVVEGVFSSLFLSTPLLVSIVNRRKDVREHNAAVAAYRAGRTEETTVEDGVDQAPAARTGAGHLSEITESGDSAKRTVSTPTNPNLGQSGSSSTWRPHRR